MDTLTKIVDILYLTKENAAFCEEDGYISLSLAESEEPKSYDRVLLFRCFPFDAPESYISVTDPDQKEIGMIRDLSDLSKESEAACRKELSRKYFTRRIVSVEKIKERYGYTHWDVTTDCGKATFSLQDTYRSITKVTPDHLLIQDIDGNVYEISSVEALSKKSYRHIELYL